MNGPLGHYLACWAKFNDFGGRSRRREYWWFFLLNQAVGTLVAIVFGSFETLSLFYTIAVTPAAVAALVRRLHDTGRSAWNLLWLLDCLLLLIVAAGTKGTVISETTGLTKLTVRIL